MNRQTRNKSRVDVLRSLGAERLLEMLLIEKQQQFISEQSLIIRKMTAEERLKYNV